jgi:hypothetical protein
MNTYLLLGLTCATYKDLRLSFLPLEFSMKIPEVPKILLSDLRSLILFVFLPVKNNVKVITLSKKDTSSHFNNIQMKLSKRIKTHSPSQTNTEFKSKGSSKTFWHDNLSNIY